MSRTLLVAAVAAGCSSAESGDVASPTATVADDSSSDEPSASTSINTTDGGSIGGSGGEPVCGDGIIEAPEQCDTQSYAGVACPPLCRFVSGTELWEVSFDAAQLADSAYSITSRADMIVVAGGSVLDAAVGERPRVLWLDAAGALVGSFEHDGQGGGESASGAFDVELTDDGGVVVVGQSFDGRVWIASVDGDRQLRWEAFYDAMAAESTTVGSRLVVQEGGVAIVFAEVDLGGDAPGRLAYYDGQGALVDEEFIAGPEASPGYTNFTQFRGARLDDSDVLLFGGVAMPAGYEPWLQRRTLAGTVAWELQLDSQPGELIDAFVDVAQRPDGSIVAIAHRKLDAAESRDAWIGAFAPDGRPLWSDAYVGEYHRDDVPVAVAADASGNSYMLLTLADDDHAQALADFDWVLIRHAPDGERQWLDRWSGPGADDGSRSWDYAGDVTIDDDGFVVATGKSYRGATDYDVVVRKLAP